MTPAGASLAVLAAWALATGAEVARGRRRWPPSPPRGPRGPGGPSRARIRRAVGLRPRQGGAGSELPELLDAVVSGLGAGHSLPTALAAAAPAARPALAAELRAVVDRIDRGIPAHDAVARWAASSAVAGAPLVAAAVGLTSVAGGDRRPALAGVAASLRERRAIEREIRALTAQARASAAVVTVAPAVFGVVAAAADTATARFLLTTPGGWSCLVAGAVLDAAGSHWMRRLAASVR